jgi:hypothetical protein
VTTPLMRPQSAPLRFLAVRLAVLELPDVVRQPGIGEALRVTVQHADPSVPDHIATLVRAHGSTAALTVVYRRSSDNPLTLDYTISVERYHVVSAALRRLSFDKLDDAPGIPWYGADLWLVERAAGSFHHDIIIAPAGAIGLYADIVTLISDQLREAVRTIHIS